MLEQISSLLAIGVGVSTLLVIVYNTVRYRFQKLWTEDIDLLRKSIEKDTRERISASHTDIIRHFENKFELLRKDIDNMSEGIKQLRSVIERYQEQHIESQIENAKTTEKINALVNRTSNLESNGRTVT